jgi:hypothetical protein
MNAVTNSSTPAINVCKDVSIRLGHLDKALQCRLLYLQHSALLHCLGREYGKLQKSRLTLQGLETFPVHSESAPQIFHGSVPSMAMINIAVQISNAAAPQQSIDFECGGPPAIHRFRMRKIISFKKENVKPGRERMQFRQSSRLAG